MTSPWISNKLSKEESHRCRIILIQESDPERKDAAVKVAQHVEALEIENDELRENMQQSTTLSVSQVCRKYNIQSCHCCELASCADNRTPSIAELKAENDRLKAAFYWLEQNALFAQLEDYNATQIGTSLEDIEAAMKEGQSDG